MSNKPTRGTPLSDDERAEGERMRRSSNPWFGGARFIKMPSFGKPGGGNGRRANRRERGRSDWRGK